MKKSLLAGCIALATAGVQAELSPMSEFELHNVTGQAGVDIELDVGLSIGEIRYTDTEEIDGSGQSDGDGGSLSIRDITLGGGEGRPMLMGASTASNTANIDNFKFAIDIKDDGTLVINGKPVQGLGIGAVDYELTTGEIALEGTDPASRHVLVDSMSIYGGALGFRMDIDGDTNNILFKVQVSVDDMDIDMTSSFGINIQNAMIKGPGFIESNGINDPGGLLLTQHAFVVYMEMDYLDDEDGVVFNFLPNPSAYDVAYNVFDIVLPEIAIGGSNFGAVQIDNLALNGLSLAVKGH